MRLLTLSQQRTNSRSRLVPLGARHVRRPRGAQIDSSRWSKPERRGGAGVVRCSARDVELLRIVGEQYVVTLPQLARLMDCRRTQRAGSERDGSAPGGRAGGRRSSASPCSCGSRAAGTGSPASTTPCGARTPACSPTSGGDRCAPRRAAAPSRRGRVSERELHADEAERVERGSRDGGWWAVRRSSSWRPATFGAS